MNLDGMQGAFLALSVAAGSIVLAAWPGTAFPDGLGKLLTTPEERALIAARRHLAENPVKEEKRGELVRFTGVARDRAGTLEVWVNGVSLGEPERLRGMGMSLLQGKDGVPRLVLLTQDHGLVPLLPGQAYDRISGRVLEAWQLGEPGNWWEGHEEETQAAPDPVSLDETTGDETEPGGAFPGAEEDG